MDDPDESDEELMIRVQAGDRTAYERLYGRWRQPVFAFLVRRTRARAAADDALQETWLRVYRYRGTFDVKRSFKSWLFAIAAHAGVDARASDPQIFEIAPEGDEPDALRELLLGALDALDPEDRRLLLLGVEGFDSAEIGEMLGLQPGTISHVAGTVDDVESLFPLLDIAADQTYFLTSYGVTSIPNESAPSATLSDAIDLDGDNFAGFTDDGVWLVDLECSQLACFSPAPYVLTSVDVP